MNRRSVRDSALLLWIAAIASIHCGSEDSSHTDGPNTTPEDAGSSDAGDADHPDHPAEAGEPDSAVPGTGGFVPGPVDDLLAELPSNAWLELPNTEMRDVCPQPLSTHICSGVQDAWSGGAYDSRRDRLVVFGGGHSDSFYNQLFAFDLGQMTWQRLTEMPAGATSSTPTDAMNYRPIEPCGYYPKAPLTVPPEKLNPAGTYIQYDACDTPEIRALLDDQQPRSSHTFSKCVYDALEDRLCRLGGAFYPSAQTSSPVVQCFSFATGRWSRVADISRNLWHGASAVDASGHFWGLPSETSKLVEYVPASDTWVSHANYKSVGTYITGDVDRKRHHLLVMTDEGVLRFDLNAPSQPGEMLVTTGAPAPFVGKGGFVYADGLDRFVAWSGGGDIYFLDPATSEWTRRIPGGATAPGPQLKNGTYGRFRYSLLRGVFVLTNGVDKNVFVYKP